MTLTGMDRVTSYTLGTNPIGSGGEGDIFVVLNMDNKVAKIYKPGIMTSDLETKLRLMVERPPNASVLDQVAWPLDVIYDANFECRGFVMPKLNINAELGEIYKYPSILSLSVHQKINIAQNICVVISEVHRAGYVFGDFNPRNIGLDLDTGLVSFLDTDTYHVTARSQTHRCNVCAPGYAAPELLEKCSNYAAENPGASKNAYAQTPLPTFTEETDNFALAIHIFKLLMNGYTPFGGVIETASVSQSSPGVGDAAVRRDNYCFKPGYKHQSAAILPLDTFPHEIADLFTRAFIVGKHDPKKRPNAEEWHGVLVRFEQGLVTCANYPLHQYYVENDDCPLCAADWRYKEAIGGGAPVSPSLRQSVYTVTPVAVQSQTPQPVTAQNQTPQTPTQTATRKNNFYPGRFVVALAFLILFASIALITFQNELGRLFSGIRTQISPSITQVLNIENLPLAATAGTTLALTGTVTPPNAANRNITWSIVDDGGTGASVHGDWLDTTSSGTVTVRATIVNGSGINVDFIQDFNIIVSPAIIPLAPSPSPTAEPIPLLTPLPTPTPAMIDISSLVQASSPSPSPTAEPTPPPTSSPTPEPTPPQTPSSTPEPTPPSTPSSTPEPTPSPTSSPMPEPTPSPTPSPTPEPIPSPTPTPTITIGGRQILIFETELHMNSYGISSIAGIGSLTDLTFLALAGNQISNISELRSLTNLTALGLGGNQISDISALSSLTRLEYLYLEDNNISDVSALHSLIDLRELNVSGNKLSDSQIFELQQALPNCAITPRVSEPAASTFSQTTEAATTPSVDYITIRGVQYSTELTELLLPHSLQNEDIVSLHYMTNLTYLSLHNSNISDLTPLSGLTNLTVLDLTVNQISDLTPLSGLTNLTFLGLLHNQISNLAPLSSLTNLTGLSLCGNQISDLTPLSGLTNLTSLSFESNQISNLTPLSGLTNLIALNIGHNQISNLTPLSGLANLHTLNLSGNQITDWSPVRHVPNIPARPQ